MKVLERNGPPRKRNHPLLLKRVLYLIGGQEVLSSAARKVLKLCQTEIQRNGKAMIQIGYVLMMKN